MEAVITKPARSKKRIPKMSSKDLEYFRQLILKKREDTVEELEFLKNNLNEMMSADDDDISSTTHHMADVGSDEQGIALTYQLIERSRKFINQLDRALERIDNGTYGICRATGKLIERGRLEFAPHTRYSIEAKRKGLDKKGVQYV